MSSSSKGNLNNIKSPVLEEDDEFSKVVSEGRDLLENKTEFQTDDWVWTRDLDDGGIFFFCYLLHDYRQKTLTLNRLKESVYTLNLLRHKMLPSREKSGLPLLGEFQVIFTLYERLKREEMTWDDCEKYIMEQISEHQNSN
ncbi:MAG: hypothetical protein QGH27_10940 [SAR324 cluster bacterium]|nr:hypothetical protein [SAR324 cluster bacterium]